MDNLERLVKLNELKAIQISNLQTMDWLTQKNKAIEEEVNELKKEMEE